MLLASVLSAELRAGATPSALATGGLVFIASVLFASAFHRRIRGRPWAQLGASALLAGGGAIIELLAGLPGTEVAAGALGRIVLFVASALLVRAAFARSSRSGATRSRNCEHGAIALAFVATLLLVLMRQFAEAGACLLTAFGCVAFASARFTAKQLRPLGLGLTGLAIVASLALVM